jgi:GcrA cell cycle regulator
MATSFSDSRNDSNSDYQKSSLTFISEYQKLVRLRDSHDRPIPARTKGKETMQSTNWAPEHSDALREYLARGMSYSEIAEAINTRFGTTYSRNATIGRGKRLGLAGPDRPEHLPKAAPKAKPPRLQRLRKRHTGEIAPPMPELERAETVKLRCVGITPRLLCLVDLEGGDCRYPYGGDKEGEAIAFCGHPQRPGSSYCAAHFHLTRGPGTASERAVGPVVLRLVEAAA